MRARVLLVAVLCGLLGCGEDDGGAGQVPLALDFTPNAVHAGIYTAAQTDIDRNRGIDIVPRAPGASTDSLKLLAAGRARFAVVDIHDLGLAAERGADVVGIGAIVQRPLAAVIARGKVSRPRDLEGRRVGVTGLPSDEAVLRAVVEHDGGRYDRVERITIGFSAVPSLGAGRVDAVVSFWNAEGVALRRRGVPTREFRVDEFGAPSYPELVLTTTRRTLEEDEPLVRRVLGALREGTAEALSDRPAAVDRIARASRADRELVQAQFRAVAPALRPPLRLDRRELRDWARFDVEFGILGRAPKLSEFFAGPGA
jgi:NitT/TauT family transport system substrate-binding protein/putative hydroxymethylpyrimidine transport system substrate-binding protein